MAVGGRSSFNSGTARATKAELTFLYPVVSGVDGRHLFIGQVDELLGQAVGDQGVGMIFTGEPVVRLLDVAVGSVPGQAQDLVGIGLVRPQLGRPDALEGVPVKTEDGGDASEKGQFRLIDLPVRLGDVEQAAEKFLQYGGIA